MKVGDGGGQCQSNEPLEGRGHRSIDQVERETPRDGQGRESFSFFSFFLFFLMPSIHN